MKVDALNFRSNVYSLGGKEKLKEKEKAPVSNPASTTGLAKVPVLVMLAMNPATLNSAIPMMPETDNPNHVVMLTPETKTSPNAAYVMNLEAPQSNKSAPFGWAFFDHPVHDVKFQMSAKGNGSDYQMVFIAPSSTNDVIDDIYLIKDGSVGSVESWEHPPEVRKLIYHNLGENSFCSVITDEHLLGPDRKARGKMEREIMLDDDSAQKIIDLISGDTKWKNKTGIQVKETFDGNISKPTIFLFAE